MLIPCLRNSFVGLAASRRYQRLRYNIFRHIAEQGRHFAREHADRPDQSPLPPSASINQHADSRQSSLSQSILYVSQEWRTPQSPRDLRSTCCLEYRRDTSQWGDPLQRSIAPHAASNPLDRCTQPATPPHPQATPQLPTPGQPSSSLYNDPNPHRQRSPTQQTSPRRAVPNRRHKPASNHEPAFVTSLEATITYHALKTTQIRLQPAVFLLYCNR